MPLFEIAKKINKTPQDIYEIIKDAFIKEKFIYTNFAKGFIDFYFDPIQILKNDEDRFTFKNQRPEQIVFEFSSPNIAKPFTIGHLRSTNIGVVLSNIFERVGNNIIRLNYLADWGTQFGKLLYAYENFYHGDHGGELDIYSLNNLYIRFHTEAQNKPEIEDKAREIFRNLECADKTLSTLWQKFYDISVAYFKKIYEKLNVKFDDIESESCYIKDAKKLTEELLKKGIAKVSQDAIIADLENKRLGIGILQKKDESTIYLSRDLAALICRFNKYKFDKIFYVVGKEQQLHFKQLSEIAVRIEPRLKDKIVHIAFGHFRFKGEKISTREGKIIYFEDVLSRGIEKVTKILIERKDIIDVNNISEKIALTALKYYDLKNHIIKDIDFSWDEALNFDGNTGPYILYTLVRIKSLFKKFKEKFGCDVSFESIPLEKLSQSEDINYLLRKILLYFDFILLAKNTREPNILCNYIFDLLKIFNNFYQRVKIIKDDKNESETLLYPVSLLQGVTREYINLFGIQEIDVM